MQNGGYLKMELHLPKPGSHCASLIEWDALHHCPIHFLETFFFSKSHFALTCKVLTNLRIGIQWDPCLQKVNIFFLFLSQGLMLPRLASNELWKRDGFWAQSLLTSHPMCWGMCVCVCCCSQFCLFLLYPVLSTEPRALYSIYYKGILSSDLYSPAHPIMTPTLSPQ